MNVSGSWYARFEGDGNDLLDDGLFPAGLIAYVLPEPIKAGDAVTVEDMAEPGMVGEGEFVEWRFGPTGHRWAALRMHAWRQTA